MATGGDLVPLWDSQNEDQQELISLTSVEQLLDRSNVVLRNNLQITEVLPHLLQLGVINPRQEETITLNAPRHVMVDRLVRHLRTCQLWCWHSVMRACALTGQKQLICEVGLNPDDYIQEGEEESQHAAIESPSQLRPTQHSAKHPTSPEGQISPQAQLMRAITEHNQGMKQTMMRRNLYDFGKSSSSKVLDTSTCHVDTDAQHEDKDGKMKDVAGQHIIVPFPGEEEPPRVIRIYGQPGVGKTALVQHIGYVKSVEFLKQLGASNPVIDGEMTPMVYIAARSITGTVEDAIYANLHCRHEDKDILYKYIKAGNGSVIGIDAIDEVRSQKVMETVKQYVSNRQRCGHGPCIIVTSRTDLCAIETEAFDRFLVARGFTESQGITYIKAYLRGEMLQKVLEYVDNHREKLYPVITNPLRCHVFCALVSEGELQLDPDDDFSIQKMFKLLETCLLKREGKEVTAEESKCFYTMCMDGLMHGLREFSQDVSDKFKIAEPFLVFLTKMQTTSLGVTKVSYSFPHEMMYEFFAGQYIESLTFKSKKSLILSICSNPALRNLQRITFEVLMQHEANQEQLLQMMLRLILILQHDHQTGVHSTLKNLFQAKGRYNKLVHLKEKVKTPKSVENILLEHQHQHSDRNVGQTWKSINNAFDKDPDWLKQMEWYRGLGNGVLGHVGECLEVFYPEQRGRLAESTIKRLLPYEYTDKKGWHSVVAVGMSRWAEVVINATREEVHAWSPADTAEALHEDRKSETAVQQAARYTTYCHINTDQTVWGQPALSAFTPDVWRQLVVEVSAWWRKTGVLYPSFVLGRSTPLPGLVLALCEEVYWCQVHGGTAGMQHVYSLLDTGKLEYVLLYTPIIIVPAGVELAVLRDMRDKLLTAKHQLHGKVVNTPNFVTETGVQYVW